MYGLIEDYTEMTGDQQLEAFKPIVQRLGWALWFRTELSDLGLALGDKKRTDFSVKGFRKELEEEIEKGTLKDLDKETEEDEPTE
jgi:hypothetical protein